MTKDSIEKLVETQIQDQMDKIEGKQVQNEAYEMLLYGQQIDNDEKEQPLQSQEELE